MVFVVIVDDDDLGMTDQRDEEVTGEEAHLPTLEDADFEEVHKWENVVVADDEVVGDLNRFDFVAHEGNENTEAAAEGDDEDDDTERVADGNKWKGLEV